MDILFLQLKTSGKKVPELLRINVTGVIPMKHLSHLSRKEPLSFLLGFLMLTYYHGDVVKSAANNNIFTSRTNEIYI